MKYFIWLWSKVKVWKCVSGNGTFVEELLGEKTIRTGIKNGKSFETYETNNAHTNRIWALFKLMIFPRKNKIK